MWFCGKQSFLRFTAQADPVCSKVNFWSVVIRRFPVISAEMRPFFYSFMAFITGCTDMTSDRATAKKKNDLSIKDAIFFFFFAMSFKHSLYIMCPIAISLRYRPHYEVVVQCSRQCCGALRNYQLWQKYHKLLCNKSGQDITLRWLLSSCLFTQSLATVCNWLSGHEEDDLNETLLYH